MNPTTTDQVQQTDLLALLFGPDPDPNPAPEAPRPAAGPKQPKPERNFFRCLDCLNVFAADGPEAMMREPQLESYYSVRPLAMRCGGCGGAVEHMGRVAADRLIGHEYLCPCDERCTCARGPSCDCRCGGENHGSGLVVKVRVDLGGVPVAGAIRPQQSAMIAAEYRAAVEAAKARIAWAYATVEAKRRGEWIRSYGDLMKAQEMIQRVAVARGFKTHKRRMKELEAIR